MRKTYLHQVPIEVRPNSNPFRYNIIQQKHISFYYSNYYSFNVNFTSFNKIFSLVSEMWQFKNYRFESDFWVSFVAAHVIVPLLYCSIPTVCSVHIFIAQIMLFLYVFLFSYCTSWAFVHRPIFCFSSVCVSVDYAMLLDYILIATFFSLITSYCFGKLCHLLCVLRLFPALHNYCLF